MVIGQRGVITSPRRSMLIFGDGLTAEIIDTIPNLKDMDGIEQIEFIILPDLDIKSYTGLTPEVRDERTGFYHYRVPKAEIIQLNDSPNFRTYLCLRDSAKNISNNLYLIIGNWIDRIENLEKKNEVLTIQVEGLNWELKKAIEEKLISEDLVKTIRQVIGEELVRILTIKNKPLVGQ